MLLVPDLFVAEITKQKRSLLSRHQYLGSKYFLYFAGYTDSRCLQYPNECLGSFWYKSTALSESSALPGYYPEREMETKMEIELIPESDGLQWFSQPLQ